MTTVTIPEQIPMNKGVKTAQFTLILPLKNTVGPTPALHKQLQWKVELA